MTGFSQVFCQLSLNWVAQTSIWNWFSLHVLVVWFWSSQSIKTWEGKLTGICLAMAYSCFLRYQQWTGAVGSCFSQKWPIRLLWASGQQRMSQSAAVGPTGQWTQWKKRCLLLSLWGFWTWQDSDAFCCLWKHAVKKTCFIILFNYGLNWKSQGVQRSQLKNLRRHNCKGRNLIKENCMKAWWTAW